MNEEQIFHEALAQEPADRSAYLDRACAGNPTLRAAVEALLRANVGASGFLSHPSPERTVDLPSAAERPGTVIGPYKLLEQIGEGGFGVVYLAEQTEPVRRKVALKILKPGMDTRSVVARFEAERQALAIMDHPNIARVFDGGTTPSGRPYFVMELVRGVPITQFCDEHKLEPRQRLELFATVCQAVQHAHQKGIIHRDLKPSNVLVSRHDTTPVVKVIDFGVAKALGQTLTDKTLFTAVAQMVGTPLYMSPEQAGMSDLDVDTRSDIYSLGVLLYELLTGTTPFTADRFRKAAYDEIRRIIREEEPPKPSTRLSDSKDSLPSISAQRHTEPGKLTKLVRGELDWIVMKALEKDRNRRYETANGFAMDVQRYLADEAVLACPPSAGYRLRKFARRNKAALVMASVIGVAILLAVGSLGWVVRDREAGRVRTAAEVNQFLERAEALYEDNKLPEAVAEVEKARGVLEAGRGDEELERRVRQWRTDLDTAAKLDEIRLATLEDRDRAYVDYAQAFREYGIDLEVLTEEEAAARVAASRIKLDLVLALSSWASWLGSDPRPQNSARQQRLTAIVRAADPDPWRERLRAAAQAKDVRTLRELADGADLARTRTRTLAYLGDSLRVVGDREAAVAFLRRAQRQHPGDFVINSALASGLYWLKPTPRDEVVAFRRAALALRPQSAWAHYNLGAALQEQKKLDEAAASHKKAIELVPTWAPVHNGLGMVLHDQGKWDEAVACYKKAIDLDPNDVLAHMNIGNTLHKQGKVAEAIIWHHKAIALDATFARSHYNLGRALSAQKKTDEAIACYRRAIELDPTDALAHHNLGVKLYHQKKLDEAIACFRRAIELDPTDALAHHNLGIALAGQNKLDEALAAHREAVRLNPNDSAVCNGLGHVLDRQNKPDEAIHWFKKAIEIDPKNAEAHYDRGYMAQHRQQKLDEAIAWYCKAIELDPNYASAHFNLSLCYAARGEWDKAAAHTGKAVELRPSDDIWWMTHATFLLRRGDIKGYRQVCQEMLKKFGPTKEPLIAHRVAATCFLSPDSVGGLKLPMQLAELSADGRRGIYWADLTMGFAHYRAGQFEQAIERLRPYGEQPEYTIGASLFLAMSHHGLGRSDEAREWLDKAVQIMDKELAAKEIGPLRMQSQSWAANQVLRAEAEKLLKK